MPTLRVAVILTLAFVAVIWIVSQLWPAAFVPFH